MTGTLGPRGALDLDVRADADAAAREAASFVAREATASINARGRFAFAVSGGSTPWMMLRSLAREPVEWGAVHLFQVDERVAPAGHEDRNWTHVQESLLSRVFLPASNLHPMPVEDPDPLIAARRYAADLESLLGPRPVLDLVHLGLGADGHTASLLPGDPALDVKTETAVAGPYHGRLRVTLTYPAIDRARRVLWLVTGAEKVDALKRLVQGDPTIPAGRVRRDHAVGIVDAAAVGSNARDWRESP